MLFNSETYKYLKSVNFCGYTFNFAAVAYTNGKNEARDDICYSLCDTDPSAEDATADNGDSSHTTDTASKEHGVDQNKRGSSSDRQSKEQAQQATESGDTRSDAMEGNWTSPLPLDFPLQSRGIGMSLLTQDVIDAAGDLLAPSTELAAQAPFEIVLDNINLWIVRRSLDLKSLLVDRFIFDKGAKRLNHASEVRFVRSGNPDLPSSDRDSYGSSDLDGNAFIEPTWLIPLDIPSPQSDSVAALLIPDSTNSKRGRWHFFLSNQPQSVGLLRHYSIPYTEFAWFDLTGMEAQVSDTGVVTALDELQVNGQSLACPVATVYEQQETAFANAGEAQRVKRAARALLSCNATGTGSHGICCVAAFDFSIGLDGSLTEIPANAVTVPPFSSYRSVLRMDGRGGSVMSDALGFPGSIFVSCWLRWDGPNANQTTQTVVSLEPTDSSNKAIYLEIRNDGIVRLVGDGNGYLCTSRLPLVPGQWANLSFSMSADASTNKTVLWLNGYRISARSSTGSSTLSGSLRILLGMRFATPGVSGPGQKFFRGAFSQFYACSDYINPGDNLVTGTPDYVYGATVTELSFAAPVFWAFDDGRGTTLTNTGTQASSMAGTIQSATWQPDVSPAQPSMPIVALDRNYLDIRAVVLSPAKGQPAQPAAGSQTSLMAGGDGLVHVYYRTAQNHAAVAHLCTSSERARYQLLQKFDDVYEKMVVLVSRQSGTTTGQLALSFGSLSNGVFSEVKFLDPHNDGYYECWRNVPARIDQFCQVINGAAGLPSAGGSTRPIYQVDCGSSTAASPYSADLSAPYRQGGGTSNPTQASIDVSSVVDAAPQAVYQSELLGSGSPASFTYSLPVTDQSASYKIRLHFAEIFFTNAGQRLFNVSINGVQVLTEFDIVAATGGINRAIVKEYIFSPGPDGKIVISATEGSVNFPKISGIEVLEAPAAGQAESASAAWGQVSYDYTSNVALNRPGCAVSSPEGPYASALFEGVGNTRLLAQNPAPSFSSIPTLAAYAGRDCGWIMSPLQPALKLNGANGPAAYAALAPALDIPGDLTMQCWLELRSNSNKAGTLAIFKQDTTDYSLSLDSTGRLVARRYGFQSGGSGHYYGVERTSQQPVADALRVWTHVAAVYHSSFALQLPAGVHVDCGHTDAMDVDVGLTLEAWVKPAGLKGGTAAIVSRRSYVDGDSSYELSMITTESSQARQLRMDVWLESGDLLSLQAPFSCNANTWAHLAGTYRPDRSFNYLHFETDDQNYVELGPLSQTPLTTFTAELYFSPRGPQKQSFLSLNRSSGSGNTNYFGLRYSNESGHSGDLCIEIEGNKTYIKSSDWTSTSDWQFLSVVIETDPSSTYITAYVDGVVVRNSQGQLLDRWAAPQKLNPGTSTSDMFHPWLIGGEWDSGAGAPGDCMDADVSEVRIWNSARSPDEVLDTLFAPLTGKEQGLLACVAFDAEAGSGRTSVPNKASGESCTIHAGTDKVPLWMTQSVKGSIRLYANGARLDKLTTTGPSRNVRKTATPLAIGRQAVTALHAADVSHLDGAVDNVRIWRVARAASQIGYFSLNPVPAPAQQAALAAFWAFDEGQGDRASDSAHGATGRLVGMRFAQSSDADALWIASPFDADWTLYLDGIEAPCLERELLTSASVTAGLQAGLVIGAEKTASGYSQMPSLYLSELQFWSLARTRDDIVRTMNQPAVVPTDGLQGYYRLNDGSGDRTADSSGHAADATLINAASAWDTPASAVPVRDEAAYVIDISNNYVSPEANGLIIQSPPAVVEDLLSQGRMYSFLVADTTGGEANAGGIFSDMGVPLADTELVYLGQVQYKPRLMGFIEGAPPVPSENLMIDSPNTPDRYVGNARITLKRSTSSKISASAGLDAGVGLGGSFGLGAGEHGHLQTIIGGWAGVGGGPLNAGLLPTLDEGAKGGVKFEASGDLSFGFDEDANVEETTTKTYGIDFCGGWENNVYKIPGNIANARAIAGQRLYRANNMGAAVVKSRTADNYAVRSKKTKAMLGYKVVPNAEIPEDINVLMFKINPKYIKNGTLDGCIGFDKDIDYRDMADNRYASYFKPEEAYRLKKTVQRSAERALSDGQQYNPFGGLASWSGKAANTSIANTYVWMADGGFVSEDSDFATSFSESFSGGASIDLSLGLQREGDLAIGWGALEGQGYSRDVSIHGKLDITYRHENENSAAASLESEVECEGFLNRVLVPINWTNTTSAPALQTYQDQLNSGAIDTTNTSATSLNGLFLAHEIKLTQMNYVSTNGPDSWTVVDLYTRYTVTTDTSSISFTYLPTGPASGQYPVNYDNAKPPCPGKVRGYRYMSFFLSPDKSNFEAFFAKGVNQIIDPAWLAGPEPDAVALREAAAVNNEVWRVLHRVTYVNRILPEPDDETEESEIPEPQDVASKPVRPDDHSVRQNSLIVNRVLKAACPQAVALKDLNLDAIDLRNVDFGLVSGEIDAILDDMHITDKAVRRLYEDEMNTFFRLLLAPN